ncbi:MAG: amidohydrolase family protein [Chitinophagaceae bacterium]
MKKRLFTIIMGCWMMSNVSAQETVYPAPAQSQAIALTNATIHVGNGQVIENGTIVFSNGKITAVGASAASGNAKVIDCKGKHIYPGLILSGSNVGLVEVSSVRATSDVREIGEYNTNIRAIAAYNTDSKVTNTLRMNGILFANIVPEGGTISGSSSLVQLDAWNWEDAAYLADNGIHFNMPSLLNRSGGRRGGGGGFPGGFGGGAPAGDPIKRSLDQIEKVKGFFREAQAYLAQSSHEQTNLKYESVKGLFSKKQKFFIHCNVVKEMLVAIDFAKEFGFEVVIVGGSDSYLIPDLLKQNNIAVILDQMHSLPTMVDDDVDQPFKTPAALQKAGVLFAINDDDGNTRQRNLAFNAGTAATYGLSKEEALSAITLNPAKILGVGDKTGSLEVGKDANLLVSVGDILDMKTNILDYAFIQGRQIELTDKHKQLYERYKYKYGLK